MKLQLRIIDFREMGLALNPTGPTMVLDEAVLSNQKQTIEVNTFELESFASNIRNIDVELTDLELGMISDYIIVEGQLEYDIYYLANLQTEPNVECYQQEAVPFSTLIKTCGIETGMEVVIKEATEVEEIELLNNKTLKQETLIDLEVSVFKREQVNVTVDETGRLITGQVVIDEGIEEFIIDIST